MGIVEIDKESSLNYTFFFNFQEENNNQSYHLLFWNVAFSEI